MDTKLAQFDGNIPENYDRGLGPHIFTDFGSDLANRVGELEPRRVLELASGTGILTCLLRDAVSDRCEVVATDLSEEMLAVATGKFDADERVTFQQADAMELPFEDRSYDAAARFFVEDPPEFYRLPFCYHDVEEISETLRQAGFQDVHTETVRLDKTVEDYELFAQGLVFGNPILEEIRARGRVDPETVRAAIAGALRSEFGDEPSSMPLQAVVFSAARP